MFVPRRLIVTALSVFFTSVALAQPAVRITAVPPMVRMTGTFHPADGSAASPVENVTFRIYAHETGGAPLWQETQNVTVDSEGHYSVLLGTTRNEGLPVEMFSSTESRWLGVQLQRSGEVEQARVLLASVPYALKAVDADTLGGRPASSYMLNASASAAEAVTTGNATAAGTSGSILSTNATPRFASTGTANFIPVFTDAAGDIGNSVLFQKSGRIGLGTTNPLDYMHVAFSDTTGILTGYAVQNLSNTATSYSGMLFYDQTGAVAQFQGFNNSTHEYRINNIASNGSINFMLNSASKFLVANSGNVGVGAATPTAQLHVMGSSDIPQFRITGNSTQTQNYFDILNSSGTTGVRAAPGANNINFAVLNDTLGVRNAADTAWLGSIDALGNIAGAGVLNMSGSGTSSFLGNVGIGTSSPTAALDVTGNVRASGMFIAAGGTASAPAIAFNGNTNTGIFSSSNNSVSIATNGTSQVTVNSSGDVDIPGSIRKNGTLFLDNIGTRNLGVGLGALAGNTGTDNTAAGYQALSANTSGIHNTAVGATAGTSNTTGNNNTFIGYNTQGSSALTNATAIGANASVTLSNTLVLGNGVNVGIGTTAPTFKLHIVDNAIPSFRIDNSNPAGSWLQLNNTGTNGHNWGILSTGTANGEGPGNLVIIDETGGGSVIIDDPLTVNADINMTGNLRKSGSLLLQNNGTQNLGVGIGALATGSGSANVAAGFQALTANTTGLDNTAVGAQALAANTGGLQNTAIGQRALVNNTSGLQNTAIGASAGTSNTTENGNTFLGFNAQGVAGIINATAIGANAKVTGNNSLVLGSLFDFNNSPTDIFVGIGTTGPLTKLHVVETNSNIFRTARFEGSSTTGTWVEIVNSSTGGHTWSLLSASTTNGEGAGNLVISDETGGGTVFLNNPLRVPSCTGCTTAPSDRNLKSDFAPVQGRSVLEHLAGIPIQTWRYKTDPVNLRHIGPMAQDFRAAFGFGEDDKHINLLDEGGVALAAIQELYRANQEKDRQIMELTKRLEDGARLSDEGKIVTNDRGEATVELSAAFPANCDFRYQLTVIGQFAQAVVSEEIHGRKFTIRTDKPNVKVSWQVTGTRREDTRMTRVAPVADRKLP